MPLRTRRHFYLLFEKLNRLDAAQECDASKDDQGTNAGIIITLVNFWFKTFIFQIPYICDHSKLFAWQNR